MLCTYICSSLPLSLLCSLTSSGRVGGCSVKEIAELEQQKDQLGLAFGFMEFRVWAFGFMGVGLKTLNSLAFEDLEFRVTGHRTQEELLRRCGKT